jgi:NADP-dependent 3-hydroxy acid dehydrogenase YdfG
VVVADLSAEKLAKVADEIGALAVPTDVSRETDIQALIAAAEANFGPVDVFYSNAGSLARKRALLFSARRLEHHPEQPTVAGCNFTRAAGTLRTT